MDDFLKILKDSKLSINIDTKSAEEIGKHWKDSCISVAESEKQQKIAVAEIEKQKKEMELKNSFKETILCGAYLLIGFVGIVSIICFTTIVYQSTILR